MGRDELRGAFESLRFSRAMSAVQLGAIAPNGRCRRDGV